jgi:hypothetical protein
MRLVVLVVVVVVAEEAEVEVELKRVEDGVGAFAMMNDDNLSCSRLRIISSLPTQVSSKT